MKILPIKQQKLRDPKYQILLDRITDLEQDMEDLKKTFRKLIRLTKTDQ